MREYLTVADAAKQFGLTAATVRQMERSGAIRAAAKTPSGMRLFDRSHIETVVRERADRTARVRVAKER